MHTYPPPIVILHIWDICGGTPKRLSIRHQCSRNWMQWTPTNQFTEIFKPAQIKYTTFISPHPRPPPPTEPTKINILPFKPYPLQFVLTEAIAKGEGKAELLGEFREQWLGGHQPHPFPPTALSNSLQSRDWFWQTIKWNRLFYSHWIWLWITYKC